MYKQESVILSKLFSGTVFMILNILICQKNLVNPSWPGNIRVKTYLHTTNTSLIPKIMHSLLILPGLNPEHLYVFLYPKHPNNLLNSKYE